MELYHSTKNPIIVDKASALNLLSSPELTLLDEYIDLKKNTIEISFQHLCSLSAKFDPS